VKNHSASILAVMIALASSGCYKYMVKTGAGGNTRGEPTKSTWQHHLIDGLIGEGAVDIAAVCGSADATVTIERTVVDSILVGMTGMLWNPSTINVYCGNKVASVELDSDQTERVARSEAFRVGVIETAPERLAELDTALATSAAR
jgi:hypothetical protein